MRQRRTCAVERKASCDTPVRIVPRALHWPERGRATCPLALLCEPDAWLLKHQARSPGLAPGAPSRITTFTANTDDADTDNTVKARLEGKLGSSGALQPINTGRGNFARGARDDFFMECRDLGEARTPATGTDGRPWRPRALAEAPGPPHWDRWPSAGAPRIGQRSRWASVGAPSPCGSARPCALPARLR